jgi:hypothetical protein
LNYIDVIAAIKREKTFLVRNYRAIKREKACMVINSNMLELDLLCMNQHPSLPSHKLFSWVLALQDELILLVLILILSVLLIL